MARTYKQHILWEPWESSGYKSSSGAIKSGPGRVGGIIIITDGTNDATVILRDGGSSGTQKVYGYCAGSDVTNTVMLPPPGVRFDTDIYLSLSGTNATVIVLYK